MRTDEIALNYALMPDFTGTDLNYRTGTRSEQLDRSSTLKHVLVAAPAAVLVTVLLRLLGPYLLTPEALIASFVLSIFAAIAVVAVTRRVLIAGAIFVAGPFLPLLIAALGSALAWHPLTIVLFGAAAALMSWLIDRMVTHRMEWLAADPRAARDSVQLRKQWWSARFSPARLGKLRTSQVETARAASAANDTPSYSLAVQRIKDLDLLRMYRYVLTLPLISVVLAIPGYWFLSVAALLLPIASMVWWCRKVTSVSDGPSTCLRLAADAFVSWMRYGVYSPPAPGVFRSPGGSPRRRWWISGTALLVFALGALPAFAYFGIVYRAVPVDERGAAFQEAVRGRPLWAERIREGDPADRASRTAGDRPVSDEVRLAGRHPDSWVWVALSGARSGSTVFLVALCSAAVMCVLYPLLVAFACLVGAASTALIPQSKAFEGTASPERVGKEGEVPWESYVRRLGTSTDARERNHLWVGVHSISDYPILVDNDILSEHAYLVGDSGSGKTALGLTSLAVQLIRKREAAVVVIDLKGDNALFNTLRDEARGAGATFKYFTNELGRSTFAFNPFLQADITKLTLNQVCETILEALSLNHGDGYGRSYYSRVARRWLSAMLRQNPSISSFEELYEAADNPENFRDEKERQDAFELIAVIESLTSFEQINLTPERGGQASEVTENAIHMPEVIREKQVVYFWLPAAVETASVRELAKLALYALIRSAYVEARAGGAERPQTYLLIDEFQRIASGNFKLVLEQARSMGLGVILANQTPGDLKTPDVDLRPTVMTNTRFKQCFSATDLDLQDELMKASGEAVYHLVSRMSSSDNRSSITHNQVILPRLRRNDVIGISDAPDLSVVHVARGKGYTQYGGLSLPVRVGFTMPVEAHVVRSKEPWPAAESGAFMTTRRALDPDEFTNAAERIRAARLLIDEYGDESFKVAPTRRETASASPATSGDNTAPRVFATDLPEVKLSAHDGPALTEPTKKKKKRGDGLKAKAAAKPKPLESEVATYAEPSTSAAGPLEHGGTDWSQRLEKLRAERERAKTLIASR